MDIISAGVLSVPSVASAVVQFESAKSFQPFLLSAIEMDQRGRRNSVRRIRNEKGGNVRNEHGFSFRFLRLVCAFFFLSFSSSLLTLRVSLVWLDSEGRRRGKEEQSS